MAPTPFDIYDINDAFAVDDDCTIQASSSSVSVMPQFLLPEIADADGLIPSDRVRQEPRPNDLRTDGRQSVNPWDPRLVGDLALGVDSTEEVIERYGLSKDEFERLCDVPAFRRELSVAVRDTRENGTAYSEKCKAMSSTYLERIDQLIYDTTTPASTVLAAAQWIAKMARLEPKEDKGDAGAAATQVNLQINFAR